MSFHFFFFEIFIYKMELVLLFFEFITRPLDCFEIKGKKCRQELVFFKHLCLATQRELFPVHEENHRIEVW